MNRISFGLCLVLLLATSLLADSPAKLAAKASLAESGLQGPVDVKLTSDERFLVTANEVGKSISVIDIASSIVVATHACPSKPAAVELLDDRQALVSCFESGEVLLVQFNESSIKLVEKFAVGFEPVGLAVDCAKKLAYVACSANASVAVIDLNKKEVLKRIEVGPWPRYLSLSPDGSRLGVSCSGDGKLYVIDTAKREAAYDEALSGGINLGHVRPSKDGKYVYFPSMIYRTNPIDVRNIQLGWVLASRIVRLKLDGPAIREAISLDVPRKAIADPHGIALSPNEHRLVCAASGSHELLVYRLADLPFEGTGGPGDLIDRKLLQDSDLFYRIELGGRPMGVVIASDNRSAYVANYSEDAVQVVDIESRKIIRTIQVGRPNREHLALRGMEIFYDGRRSLDQWYSCHTCHYNGGINSRAMDTKNDGSIMTYKTVLPLYHVSDTAPWTWHGWQKSLPDSISKSFTESMQGRPIEQDDLAAVQAFFDSLDAPASPFRSADGSLTEAAKRGKKVFESDQAACARCHSGSLFTDGEIHDVGLGSENDYYKGYNTPSLVGLCRKVRYLHDGRTKSLEALLNDFHSPEKVSGTMNLSDAERSDLIEYLKSL